MNEALNVIMSMMENGTDLYEAFQAYVAEQKVLFKEKTDSEYALFAKYLTDLEDEGFTSKSYTKKAKNNYFYYFYHLS